MKVGAEMRGHSLLSAALLLCCLCGAMQPRDIHAGPESEPRRRVPRHQTSISQAQEISRSQPQFSINLSHGETHRFQTSLRAGTM